MKTIGIFKSGCPSGWSLMSAWVGKFLQGAASSGGTGGAGSHQHSANIASITDFGSSDPIINPGNQNYGPEYMAHFYHNHSMDPPSANTTNDSVLPEYIDVVFCYKEE